MVKKKLGAKQPKRGYLRICSDVRNHLNPVSKKELHAKTLLPQDNGNGSWELFAKEGTLLVLKSIGETSGSSSDKCVPTYDDVAINTFCKDNKCCN